MTLNVTLNLPGDVEDKLRRESSSLETDVKEAYLLELYRNEKISHVELAQALGLDRFETDAFLKRHNVFNGSLTMADLDADFQTVLRVMEKSR